jgi:Lamin Tail Domain
LLLASTPILSFAACSIYDSSLLGSGGSTSTTGPGSTATATATSTGSGMGGDPGTGGDMSTGTGGAKPCTTVAECSGSDTECGKRTCKDGTCGVDFTAAGTALAAQTAKDCLKAVCDGAGATKSIPENTDTPDDGNDCTDDTCAAGVPTFTAKAAGSACSMGAKKCTMESTCVECIVGADCASSVCDATTSTCAPAGCGDKVKNGTESDVDCGGAACPPCATGQKCAAGSDCVGGSCAGMMCAPTCTDGLKNNGEADVDCGGPCAVKCDVTKACASGSDCKTGSCVAQACSCANDHLVISEVRSRGAAGASDEIIEIYNPTSAAVVLDATWKVEARSSTASTYGTARWTGNGKSIPAHGHYLLTNTSYTQSPAHDDPTTTTGITDASSIRLVHNATVVDAVCYGFSAATKSALQVAGYDCEGTPADNLPHNNTSGVGDADVSLQRLPGGALGNCIDTGDNAADFITTTPAAPQSSTSPATP